MFGNHCNTQVLKYCVFLIGWYLLSVKLGIALAQCCYVYALLILPLKGELFARSVFVY